MLITEAGRLDAAAEPPKITHPRCIVKCLLTRISGCPIEGVQEDPALRAGGFIALVPIPKVVNPTMGK